MINIKNITIFVSTLLVVSMIFITLSKKSYSGLNPLGCCQFFKPVECGNIFTKGGIDQCNGVGEFNPGQFCDMEIDECTDTLPPTNPPPT